MIAPPEIAPADDDREMFVAAWCKLIPAEKNIFIPEPPGEALIPGEALYIQADDVVLNRLPGLRYLVRMRVVEIQDWSTPPLSDDEGGTFWRDDPADDDSDDSNHNRRHPGIDDRGDRPRKHGPRSTRFAGTGDTAPHLGARRVPTFMNRSAVLVGTVPCPFAIDIQGRPRSASVVAADRGADLRGTTKTDVAIVVDEGHALVNNGDLVKKPPCSTKPGGRP